MNRRTKRSRERWTPPPDAQAPRGLLARRGSPILSAVLLPALLSALLIGPAAAGATAAVQAGRPLAEALRSFQEEGLPVVFTSELVRPEMEVAEEPEADDPRRALEEILAPHGLAVREGPGGILVVVRGEEPPAAGRIDGRVLERGSRREIAAAEVRLEGTGRRTPAGPDGAFAFPGLAPGRYTLAVAAEGYLERRVSGVRVPPGGTREVVLHLDRQPYLEEEIVVRPSRLALFHERPDAPFAWSREELRSLPHLGGDVLRATSLLPGTAANDVTARFSVHGGRRDEVRILLDGQELYDAFHLEDYDEALSIVPGRGLSSASLSTGAFPASQGDRMSGVLDLRTADPVPGGHYALGIGAFDAFASASGRLPRLGRTAPADDPGGWLVTARRGSLDLAGDAIGDENPAFWDVLAKAQVPTRIGAFTAHVLAAGDELELDRTDEDGFEVLENDYRRLYGWLTHRAALGDRLLVETTGSWSGIRRDRGSTTLEEEGSFALRDRRDLDVLSLSQEWSFGHRRRGMARWGWEARRYDATFDYLRDQDPEIEVLAPFAPPRETFHRFDGTLTGDHLGLWASERLALFGRLTAEVGARWDRHTATDEDLVSPRVNLAWRLGERSVLRGAWGWFHQSQRPYELEVKDGETELHPAERSEHWVLGYEALPAVNPLGLAAVRIELFRREVADPRPRYENLLEPLNFFPEIEPDRVRIAPERSTAEGVELLLQGRVGTRLGWWMAYTRSRVRDRLGGERVPRSLDQPDALSLDLDYRLGEHWHVNLAWRHHTGWPITPVEGRFVADPEEPEEDPELVAVFGALNSERLPPYHRLDLRASRGWTTRTGHWTLYLDVQNLYDRQNLAGFDLAVEEDEGVVELEEEHWPGLFPSFGIIWER